MQQSVFRYKWRVNGLGAYCHTSGGPQPLAGGSGFPFWGPTQHLSTHHTFSGSTLVSDNEWLYTELIINGDGVWSATTCYGGYGSGTPLTSPSGTLSEANLAALNDMYLRHSICDNYVAGQYFEIAEAYIDLTPGTCIPAPGAVALGTLGAALVGYVRRRRVL
jgi:hypothetical protein